MSKQLRLFAAKPSTPCQPYFKNAQTTYEKFVNKKWKESSLNYNSKQEFLKGVLKDWEKIKNDHAKLADYMAKVIVPSTKRKVMNFFKVPMKKLVFQGMSYNYLPCNPLRCFFIFFP